MLVVSFLMWSLVIIMGLTERTFSEASSSDQVDEFPLSKSLGFSVRQRLGKNLEDRISQEFLEKYDEMKKASQESFENFHVEEKRLRRVVDDEGYGYDLTKEVDVKNKRRSANKLQSVSGIRRERSQALRREKLNSQSLRSHMHHSKLNNMEFSND